jgi:L-fuculose-phosphate aldolase
MLRLGLVTGTAGNASARAGGLIRITPSALPYEEMTVDDLVTLGPDGAVVAGGREPSSEWRVHVAVYAARPEARALMHTHSEHATAWSEGGKPLGRWLTAPYFPSGSDEIADAAVAALGDRDAVLLGRHGVLAVGDTPARALEVCVAVEEAARRASGIA